MMNLSNRHGLVLFPVVSKMEHTENNKNNRILVIIKKAEPQNATDPDKSEYVVMDESTQETIKQMTMDDLTSILTVEQVAELKTAGKIVIANCKWLTRQASINKKSESTFSILKQLKQMNDSGEVYRLPPHGYYGEQMMYLLNHAYAEEEEREVRITEIGELALSKGRMLTDEELDIAYDNLWGKQASINKKANSTQEGTALVRRYISKADMLDDDLIMTILKSPVTDPEKERLIAERVDEMIWNKDDIDTRQSEWDSPYIDTSDIADIVNDWNEIPQDYGRIKNEQKSRRR
jgi:hypothetical protein